MNRPCNSIGSGYRADFTGEISDYERLPFACERRIYNVPDYMNFVVENVQIPVGYGQVTFKVDITMLQKPLAEITTILRAAHWNHFTSSAFSAMPVLQYNSTSETLFITALECDATDLSNAEYNTEYTQPSLQQPILRVGQETRLILKISRGADWDNDLGESGDYNYDTLYNEVTLELKYSDNIQENFYGLPSIFYNNCNDYHRTVV